MSALWDEYMVIRRRCQRAMDGEPDEEDIGALLTKYQRAKDALFEAQDELAIALCVVPKKQETQDE